MWNFCRLPLVFNLNSEKGSMPKIFCLIVSMCVLLAPMHAGAVTLRYQTEKGSVVHQDESFSATLRVTNTADKQQTQVHQLFLRAGYSEIVSKTTEHGVVSSLRTLDKGNISFRPVGSITLNRHLLSTRQMMVRTSDRGKILSVRHSTRPVPADEGFNTRYGILEAIVAHLPFPSRDLKPGDTWNDSIVLPDFWGGRPGKVTLNARLLGVGVYKGRSCAHIRAFFTIPVDMKGTDFVVSLPLSEHPNADSRVMGILTTTLEYQFDYKNNVLVSVAGPVTLSATLPLTAGPVNITGHGKLAMNLREVKGAAVPK